ncbi:hypothetical protein LINGRAHAP2_LOCUS13800, partial [Linum grandiflorum]
MQSFPYHKMISCRLEFHPKCVSSTAAGQLQNKIRVSITVLQIATLSKTTTLFLSFPTSFRRIN